MASASKKLFRVVHYTLIRVMFVVGVALLSVSCATDALQFSGTWRFEGLEGKTVYQLRAHGERVYAGTEQGLYYSEVAEKSWKSMGLDEASVRTFVVFSEQELLAQVHFEEEDSSTIAKTVDGGQSWQSFRNGFGGGSRVTPRALEIHPDDPDVLFARGLLNVAISTDRGRSWENIYSDWDWFGYKAPLLKIDPARPDIIWAGGSNAVFQPILARSTDGGETWRVFRENLQIYPDQYLSTTAYDIAIRPGRSSHLLLGLGAGVFRSADLGQTWEAVYAEAAVLALAGSPRSGGTVYAAGINRARTPFVLVTPDFGDTWRMVEMEDGPAGVRVNDLVVVETGGAETVFLGTNRGVYSFRLAE